MKNNDKWIDAFIRATKDITEPGERSLLYMVLTGIITEYKKGTYQGKSGIDILNSFGIQNKHIEYKENE